MKYVIVQGDGMADRPLAELGGRTPLDAARTPNLDRMASRGILGMTATIPKGMPPGSDVGTMSVLGYDPRCYHTGPSAIEAAGMGVDLDADAVAFCCNLVTVEGLQGEEVLADFSAGHIGSAEAARLIADLAARHGADDMQFHAGAAYRHLLVWRGGIADVCTTPPHDIAGKRIAGHLPTGDGCERLSTLMEDSRALFREHPVNAERRARGEREATQIWLWGPGRRPEVPSLKERFGLEGAVVAGVDLVKGLGTLAGLRCIAVPGATGYLDTDYGAKASHGLEALADPCDFLLLHVEAPDEAGHMGNVQEKIKAIEAIDEKIIGPLIDGLCRFGDWRLMVLADHVTPCVLKTHSDEAVPFTVFASSDLSKRKGPPRRYTEVDAQAHGIFIPEGHTLLERFLRR